MRYCSCIEISDIYFLMDTFWAAWDPNELD